MPEAFDRKFLGLAHGFVLIDRGVWAIGLAEIIAPWLAALTDR
jgi:hypothetical protein